VRRMFAQGQRLRAEFGDDAVIDLALGQPLAEPLPEVRDALLAAATERGRARFGYMPNLGFPEVRERVAAHMGVEGLERESIILTGGAGAAVVLALRAFVDAGDEVVGITPYFGEYPAYCNTIGATFVPAAPSDDGGLDLEAIATALTPRTRALVLNTPCNPSGHVVDESEMAALAEVLEEHAPVAGGPVLLIVDEVYHRLVYPPARRVDPFALHPHSVLARSFSKDLGLAGERIGYLALHPALATPEIGRALEVCMRAVGFVNAPATMQRMLLHLPVWQVDTLPYVERRDHAVACAREAGLDVGVPDGALYLWARSPWDDTLDFVQTLARRRVLVAPGVGFGMPSHLRICFTAPRERLEEAMEIVSGLVSSAPRSALG